MFCEDRTFNGQFPDVTGSWPPLLVPLPLPARLREATWGRQDCRLPSLSVQKDNPGGIAYNAGVQVMLGTSLCGLSSSQQDGAVGDSRKPEGLQIPSFREFWVQPMGKILNMKKHSRPEGQ